MKHNTSPPETSSHQLMIVAHLSENLAHASENQAYPPKNQAQPSEIQAHESEKHSHFRFLLVNQFKQYLKACFPAGSSPVD